MTCTFHYSSLPKYISTKNESFKQVVYSWSNLYWRNIIIGSKNRVPILLYFPKNANGIVQIHCRGQINKKTELRQADTLQHKSWLQHFLLSIVYYARWPQLMNLIPWPTKDSNAIVAYYQKELVLKEYSKPRPQSNNKVDPRDIFSKLIGFLGRYSVSCKGTTISRQKFLDE